MSAKQVLHQRLKEQAVDAEFFRSKFVYSPFTGRFTWTLKWAGKKPGDRAGGRKPSGYIDLKVNKVLYRAHRVAWLYMTGEWPVGVVDHIDRNPSNNAWDNLRDTNQSVNVLNSERSDRVKARKAKIG